MSKNEYLNRKAKRSNNKNVNKYNKINKIDMKILIKVINSIF